MITPAIDCSTGVHSTPNPREGWTVGVPVTRTVALAGGKTRLGEGTCWASERAFAASVAACWAEAPEAHKASIKPRGMARFMCPLQSGRSRASHAPSPPGANVISLRLAPRVNAICIASSRIRVVAVMRIGNARRRCGSAGRDVNKATEGVRLTDEQRLNWLRLKGPLATGKCLQPKRLVERAEVNLVSLCCLFPCCFNGLRSLPAIPSDMDATR